MDIKKLPKWAQEHIKKIENQRDVAVTQLNNYIDEQTESPFYVSDLVCTGEGKNGIPVTKKQYIQTTSMTVEHLGVRLDVILRGSGIDIGWDNYGMGMHDVAFIPSSYQQARLVTKDNMTG